MGKEEILTPKPVLEIKYHKYHRVFKFGGSLAVTITTPLREIGVARGDRVSVKVEGDHITIRKIKGVNDGRK